jgi:glycosyltransferase involved in cell wall biosynthesis
VTTIIIPAHNEGRVIGRLLGQVVPASPVADLHILVVANGCTDDTAAVAASFGPCIRVIAIPEASKCDALIVAYAAVGDFLRIYVDADVELRTEDVQALTGALRQPGVFAVAPERVLTVTGRPWPVRWYYDVWSRLPEVRDGLWGRGVIAVNDAGQQRIAALPALMADDLAFALAFAPSERRIVPDARVVIHTPRKVADLLRRRVRAVTGTIQLERAADAPASTARTRVSDLVAVSRAAPRMAPRVVLFLAITVLARIGARYQVARADYSTWLRDESSRIM